MIRKLLKRLGILLAILLLVPVVLGLLAMVLVPKDRVRDEVAAKLAEATGAQVELGDPSVTFWPNLGVRLDGGLVEGTGPALAEATGSANKLEAYRIDLENLDIQVELKPLLSKQIKVSEVVLAGPRLLVSWDKGAMNATNYRLSISDVQLSMEAAQARPAGQGKIPVGEMIPEDLSLNFDGQAEVINLQGFDYDEVLFTGDLDARLITLESLTCRRSTGTISAEGEIDYERDVHGELDFRAEVLAVPAGSLLEPWAPDLAQRLTGDLSGEVSGTCNLKDKETVVSTLDLNGELGCGEGELKAGDWLRDVSSYLGDRQDLKNITFRGLEHLFRVDGGKYLLEKLVIDGHETHWQGKGWIGLDGALDAGLRVKLPAGFTPELGQWSFLADALRDEEGRVNLDLRFTGRTAKPKVGVDLSGLQGAAGQGANGAVKKGLGGLLDKWRTR